MKWIGLLLSIVIAVLAYKYVVYDMMHPKAGNPTGTAGAFVEAAQKGDRAAIAALCEPAVKEQAFKMAEQLKKMTIKQPLPWQAQEPSHGDKAVVTPLTGSGKILVVEMKETIEGYRICALELADY